MKVPFPELRQAILTALYRDRRPRWGGEYLVYNDRLWYLVYQLTPLRGASRADLKMYKDNMWGLLGLLQCLEKTNDPEVRGKVSVKIGQPSCNKFIHQ